MRAKLIVNGVDLGYLIAEDGLDMSFMSRRKVSVVDLDGIEHCSEITKRKIAVTLLPLNDSLLALVSEALYESPGVVTYTEKKTNVERTSNFYIRNFRYKASKVYANETIWKNVAFDLEEV